VALDTNRFVDLCRGVVDTVTLLEEADAIMVPSSSSVSCGPALRTAGGRPRTSGSSDASL